MKTRHQSDRSDVVADLKYRAAQIASNLAAAFGGKSQVSPEDIGRAVAGNMINNGLTVHGTAEEVCVAVYEATLYPGDDHYSPDEPRYDLVIPRAVGACWERLSCSGCSMEFPYPMANPMETIHPATRRDTEAG